MGLFRRTRTQQATDRPTDQVTEEPTDGPADPSGDQPVEAPADRPTDQQAPGDGDAAERPRGPFDASQVTERGARIDLGAVWLPGVPGMELRMEVDKKTQRITGVSCAVGGSGLQVQAFAAPRSEGIWDEIRGEIAQSVTQQGGAVDDVPGRFGRELIARLPVKAADGRAGVRPARFVGVDGPRWFLRGVLTGKAAVDPQEARVLEAVFANIVVVRDQVPRPPRDLLTLHLPGKGPAAGAAAPGATVPGAAPGGDAPSFDPLTRGPEITEIR